MPYKILAVDDEPSIVRLVTAALSAKGYEVVNAFNGEEALDKVALEHPDLIVCDIMMPRMDGREVQRRLAADAKTRDIPFIFLSAIGDLDQQLHTLEEGGAEYLTKPFKPSELTDYVAALLDPARKDELARMRQQHVGRLRAMTSIMHRKT
ncbi:MAG: response regulator [Coriobacteriia bacterium]|nr:response regulator [Coriobacteriia bacterium]